MRQQDISCADKSNARESFSSIHKYLFILLYFDIKPNFYGKFRPSLPFTSKHIWKICRPWLRLEFLSKKSPLSRRRNMTEKKHTQKEYNYMYEITENIDNDKLNITYLLFGSLSPCFKQKNWKWYFTVDCLSECCNYRLQTCVKVLLRTFARKFSNIDFFLKILPLKNDELVMSEM